LKAQVTLTPAEGKRLIAHCVANMEAVRKAYREGILVVATGTTNAYLVEELTGLELPDKGMFTAGVVTGEAASITVAEGRYKHRVYEGGSMVECTTGELVPFLARMGPEDVFVKGANAIDPYGDAGILVHGGGGGTIGAAWGHLVRNGVQVVIPVGLDKMVPVSLRDVAGEMGVGRIDKSLGFPCGLFVVHGDVVTEVEAFRRLFQVEAFPVAGGGIHGGEGARVFLLEGSEEGVEAAYEYVLSIKGEPPLETRTMKASS